MAARNRGAIRGGEWERHEARCEGAHIGEGQKCAVKAEMAAGLEGGGAERALHHTSCRTRVAASALRPPTSFARLAALQLAARCPCPAWRAYTNKKGHQRGVDLSTASWGSRPLAIGVIHGLAGLEEEADKLLFALCPFESETTVLSGHHVSCAEPCVCLKWAAYNHQVDV
eukprot:s8518_g3.t1